MQSKSLLFLSLIACFLVLASSLHVAAGDAQVLQQVSANGQRNLHPFAVKDKWEIQWDSKGTLLGITIYRADGKMLEVAATQNGPGTGSSYQPLGGEYYLQVSGTGEWTVTVVQLP